MAADDPADGPVYATRSPENVDRACYVALRLETHRGPRWKRLRPVPEGASDASALIGQQVTFTTERASVLAASCEGDMDCGKSDQVELVKTISAAAP